jgi:hypothetical protein
MGVTTVRPSPVHSLADVNDFLPMPPKLNKSSTFTLDGADDALAVRLMLVHRTIARERPDYLRKVRDALLSVRLE